jgi:lysozyme family protein
MTDIFKEALDFTLRWEGGYVNNPNDPGGETNKGVTKSVYDAYRQKKGLSKQSVKNISDSEVYDIYKNQYWFSAGCDTIQDAKLAISVFDFAVNGGVARAKRYLALTKDSVKFNNNRIGYYTKIVKVNPKLQTFLKGWSNRVLDLNKYIEKL